MTTTDESLLDKEIEAFNTIVAALGTLAVGARPRILAASAIIHGIEELPVVMFAPRPV